MASSVVRLTFDNGDTTFTQNLLKFNNDYQVLAQQFTVGQGFTLDKVSISLKKTGSPTGTMTLAIHTDSTNDPSGSVITNGTANTVAESGLATSYGYIDFTFAVKPTLAQGTKYHLVLSSNRANSETNYVEWAQSNGASDYTGGVSNRQDTGLTWTEVAGDFHFKIYGPPGAGGSFIFNVL